MRETLFNWLGSDVAGSRVLDLFAGSGALGFEALSRGAVHADFVDTHSRAVNAIRDNIANFRTDAAEVHHCSAAAYLAQAVRNSVDILFIDPPFELNVHAKIIDLVHSSGVLRSGGLLYIEAPLSYCLQLPPDWRILQEKSSGQVKYLLLVAWPPAE